MNLLDTVTSDLSKIKRVELIYECDDIKVRLVEKGDCMLELREYMDGGSQENFAHVTFDEVDSVLKIEGGKRVKAVFGLITSGKLAFSNNCELDLPAGYTGELCINTTSGDIDMECPGAQYPCLLDMNTVSGDVDIEGYEGPELSLSTVSGDLILNRCKVKKLSTCAVSGDVHFRGEALVADGNSTSGDLKIDLKNAPNLVNCCAVSGDVEVILPADTRVQCELSAVSGDIRNKFEKSDSPEATKVSVSTVSGDISIHKA